MLLITIIYFIQQMEAGLDLVVTVLVHRPVEREQKQEQDLVLILRRSVEGQCVLDQPPKQ